MPLQLFLVNYQIFCRKTQFFAYQPSEAKKRGGFSVVSDRAASDLEAFELLGRIFSQPQHVLMSDIVIDWSK